MLEKLKFPLNIQLFADGGEGGDGQGQDGTPLTFDEILGDPEYQAEFDRRVQAAIQTNARKQRSKGKEGADGKDPEEDVPPAQPEVNPYIEKYAQAEIKVAMAQQGIDAGKVNRAVRLIDHSAVLTEEGDIDVEKLNTAIADLLKEWPELAPQQGDNNNPFKIGSDKNKNKGKEDDLIANAFGNNT